MKERTPNALKTERVSIFSVKENPRNTRGHGKENLDAIEESLKRFGQVEPLVVQRSTGFIIGGNGRYAVMCKLGWEFCDVIKVDLEGTEMDALGIVLNKTGTMGHWNIDLLEQQMRELMSDGWDLQKIGWSQSELPEFYPQEAVLEPEDNASRAKNIRVTPNQRSVIEPAIEKIRFLNDDPEMSEGRALELMSALMLTGGMRHDGIES